MLTNYLKSLVITGSIIIGSAIIMTIFNYFNILNGTALKIIEILIPIIAIFSGGYLIGKVSSKRGYIEGIKYGAIWIIILLIFNLIIKDTTLFDFIYFLILLLFSTLASMIGINKKSK